MSQQQQEQQVPSSSAAAAAAAAPASFAVDDAASRNRGDHGHLVEVKIEFDAVTRVTAAARRRRPLHRGKPKRLWVEWLAPASSAGGEAAPSSSSSAEVRSKCAGDEVPDDAVVSDETRQVDVSMSTGVAYMHSQRLTGCVFVRDSETNSGTAASVRLRVRVSTERPKLYSSHSLRLPDYADDLTKREELLSSVEARARAVAAQPVDDSAPLASVPFPAEVQRKRGMMVTRLSKKAIGALRELSSPAASTTTRTQTQAAAMRAIAEPEQSEHNIMEEAEEDDEGRGTDSASSSDEDNGEGDVSPETVAYRALHGSAETSSKSKGRRGSRTSRSAMTPTRGCSASAEQREEREPVEFTIATCTLRLCELPDDASPVALVLAGSGAKVRLRARALRLPAASTSFAAAIPLLPTGSWSLRVHVHEVRGLRGVEAKTSSADPYVTVRALGRERRTQVRRDTLSAVYDRLLFFGGRRTGAEMQGECMALSVYDWNFWTRSVLIGSYTFDFMHLWHHKDHTMAYEWLPLTNPSDENFGVSGYLCVSVMLFGPGIVPAAASLSASGGVAQAGAVAAAAPPPRLLKNLVLEQPRVEVEQWVLEVNVLRLSVLDVARRKKVYVELSMADGGSGGQHGVRVPGAGKRPPKPPRTRAKRIKRANAGDRGGADGNDAGDNVDQDGESETTFNTAFRMPIAVTTDGRTSFEDVVLRIVQRRSRAGLILPTASSRRRQLGEVHLELSELLASGLTCEIEYIDGGVEEQYGKVTLPARAAGAGAGDFKSRAAALLSELVLRARERLGLYTPPPTKPFSRERVVFAVSPRYVNIYESPARYRGRVLLSMRMWRKTHSRTSLPLGAHRLTVEQRFAAAVEQPRVKPYTLSVRVHELTELPVDDGTRVTVQICLGGRVLMRSDSSGAEVRHLAAAWTPPCGGDVSLRLPDDLDNVADLFVDVYYGSDRVAFLRVNAKMLRALSPEEPRWWLMDSAGSAEVEEDEIAGMAYAALGLTEERRHQQHRDDDGGGGGGGEAQGREVTTPSGEGAAPASSRSYVVRCYVLQGRQLPSADESGFSDPFLVVRCGRTVRYGRRLARQTCNPQFFECIELGEIPLEASGGGRRASLPDVSIQVYDWDGPVDKFDPSDTANSEYLGRAIVRGAEPDPRWYDVFTVNPLAPHGRLLAAFDVFPASSPADLPAPREFAPRPRALGDGTRGADECRLRIGVVSFRELNFFHDPRAYHRDHVCVRFYIDADRGECRTSPVGLTRRDAFLIGSAEVCQSVTLALPPLPDVAHAELAPSLQMVIETAAQGRFLASATMPLEKLVREYATEQATQRRREQQQQQQQQQSGSSADCGCDTRLIVGSYQQHVLERLGGAIPTAMARANVMSVEKQGGGASAASQSIGKRIKLLLRGVLEKVRVPLIQAQNMVVEYAPEAALRFGIEEIELPRPSSASSSLQTLGGADKKNGSGDDDDAIARVSAAQYRHQRGVVESELERYIEDTAAFHEVLLYRGATVPRKRSKVGSVLQALPLGGTATSLTSTKRTRETVKSFDLLREESERTASAMSVGKAALELHIASSAAAAAAASSSAGDGIDYAAELRQRYTTINDAVVRVHLIRGINLQSPSGTANVYVKVALGADVRSTKPRRVARTLQPLLFQSFEFRKVRFPGARLLVRVKDFDGPDFDIPVAGAALRATDWTFGPLSHERNSNSVDVDLARSGVGRGRLIGETEIDLDQRWYNAAAERARLRSPVEVRSLWAPDGATPNGRLEMFAEVLSAAEARRMPFEPVQPPAPEKYELRVVVWRVRGCVPPVESEQGRQAGGGEQQQQEEAPLQDLIIRGMLGSSPATQRDSDVSRHCDNGSANFNYRFVWKLQLPAADLVPRLRLQVWDRRPTAGVAQRALSFASITEAIFIADTTVDLSSVFQDAVVNRSGGVRKQRQWLPLRFPSASMSTAASGAGVLGASARVEISLELLPEREAARRPESAQNGHSGLPAPLRPVKFSAFAPQRYVQYRIARLLEDGVWQAVGVALLVPLALAGLKVLARLPLWMYLGVGVVGLALFLRMLQVQGAASRRAVDPAEQRRQREQGGGGFKDADGDYAAM